MSYDLVDAIFAKQVNDLSVELDELDLLALLDPDDSLIRDGFTLPLCVTCYPISLLQFASQGLLTQTTPEKLLTAVANLSSAAIERPKMEKHEHINECLQRVNPSNIN